MQWKLPFEEGVSLEPPSINRVPPPSEHAGPPADRYSTRSDEGRQVSVSAVDSTYFVRHCRARRYLLRVESDGRVRVTIPRGGSKREAEAFVCRHAAWVARQQRRIGATRRSRDEIDALREQAKRELPPRLHALAAEHGLVVSRVSIRNQRWRWGSCGRDGHIALNWRLVLMPAWVRDYVLIHELMHLRRMDHSPEYWALVEAACPECRVAREWLRTQGRLLN